MKTTKGRVVYDRKRHDFRWVDALRMISRGLGIPEYVDSYIAMRAGLPKYKIDTSPDAAREYVCMMLVLDTLGILVSAMPKGAADGPTLTTAYSFLKPTDQRKYARVKEIQLGRLVKGLLQVADLVQSNTLE